MTPLISNRRRMLRVAGVLVWVLSGVPAVLMLLGMRTGLAPAQISSERAAMWTIAAVVFVVAFWFASGAEGSRRSELVGRILIGIQSIAALTMFHSLCTGFETVLLAVIAAQVGLAFSTIIGIAWLLVQAGAQFTLGLQHFPAVIGIWWSAFSLVFAALAWLTAQFASSQIAARSELARTNAELRVAQALLADSTRHAERLRISRDLHDLLGHFLTALSLRLEAAAHLTSDRARDQIAEAQELTRRLMRDVREAVRELRPTDIDLRQVLAPLTENMVKPRVHLSIPDDLDLADPVRAQAIVRCVQEITTNAAKHADAANLWIELRETTVEIEVRARDDGRGARDWHPGQGLTSMRERLEALGGGLHVDAWPPPGFRVRAWLPIVQGEA